MKMKKYVVLAAMAVMVAALALVGCSSPSTASSSAASSSESSSSASASSDATSSSASAAAEEVELVTPGTLTILTSPDFPPFESLENGEYVGLDIEIAKAVAEKLGYTPEFKTLQFDGIIPAVAAGGQGDIGISGFTVDPDRAKQVDFTETYYIDDQAIAVMDSSDITEANATEALNQAGVIIAVQSGTTGETYVQENFPNATVQPYGNSTDAFAALQSGQANAVCTNLAVVQSMIQTAYQDARIVEQVATGEEYAIAVSQDNPALTKEINEALKELTADGTIDELVQKHMSQAVVAE